MGKAFHDINLCTCELMKILPGATGESYQRKEKKDAETILISSKTDPNLSWCCLIQRRFEISLTRMQEVRIPLKCLLLGFPGLALTAEYRPSEEARRQHGPLFPQVSN